VDLCPAPLRRIGELLAEFAAERDRCQGAHPHDEVMRVERDQPAATAQFAAIEVDQLIPKAELQTRDPMLADRAGCSRPNQQNPRGFQGKISVFLKFSAAIPGILYRPITVDRDRQKETAGTAAFGN